MTRSELFRRVVRAGAIVALAAGVFIIGTPVALRTVVDSVIFAQTGDVPASDVAIVLGASVVRGKPSPVLAERANAAIELFQKGKVHAILVTGDSQDRSHDEVTPVRKYLEAAGIPQSAIWLDREGFDTYSSMYRAKVIFGATHAIVVTQDFHLPRAVFLARSLGIDASGFIAPGTERSPYEYLREIPASVKAVWDVLSHRIPDSTNWDTQRADDESSAW